MTTIELMKCIGLADDIFLAEIRDIGKPEKNTKPYFFRHGLKIAAIAAALLLLVGCTVKFILRDAPMMETIFGVNGGQSYTADKIWGIYTEPGGKRTELDTVLTKKYIDPYVFPVEGTLFDGETTLTVLSCIADRTSCTGAVYLKLENPPEYKVYNSGWLLFKSKELADIWFIRPKAIGQEDVIGRCIIDEASTNERELYYVFLFSCEPDCTALELEIGDRPDRITIPLPEKTDMPSILLENGDIAITPFGMKVSSAILKQDDDPRHPEYSHREIAIAFKDGSEYTIQSKGMVGENDYNAYSYGMALNMSLESYVYIFNRVVDIHQVAAFRINDHVYSIS